MDIYLKNILPNDGNPFEIHPELKTIWVPELCQIAIEAVEENFELRKSYLEADLGQIFLICLKDKNNSDKIIGISGYFPSKEDFSEFTLRWHGLLKEYRGRGYSKKVISFISSYIASNYSEAKTIIEFMPVDNSFSKIESYFEKNWI